MAAAGLWRSSSSLRPSPADSPLIDSGGARRGRQRGPGAGPGRREPGRLPTPLGLSPPEPPTLHPFPQRIGRRPAGGRGAGAASSPPLSRGYSFRRFSVPLVAPLRSFSRRSSSGARPAGPPCSQTCCLRISRPLLIPLRPPLKTPLQHPSESPLRKKVGLPLKGSRRGGCRGALATDGLARRANWPLPRRREHAFPEAHPDPGALFPWLGPHWLSPW